MYRFLYGNLKFNEIRNFFLYLFDKPCIMVMTKDGSEKCEENGCTYHDWGDCCSLFHDVDLYDILDGCEWVPDYNGRSANDHAFAFVDPCRERTHR